MMGGWMTGTGDEDGGRAVRAADDADGRSLLTGKAQPLGAQEGGEDTQLRSSTQQQALRVGDQRTEVGHGTNAQEDQRRINTQLNAHVEHIAQAAVVQDVNPGGVQQNFVAHTNKVLHVDDVAAGQVGQDHTKRDGQQQQRLKAADDGQVQQEAAHHQHNDVQGLLCQAGKAGVLDNAKKGLPNCAHSSHSSFLKTGRCWTEHRPGPKPCGRLSAQRGTRV